MSQTQIQPGYIYSTIWKALAYSIYQVSYLRTYLTDGDVPMNNNYAEQAIRPFTIGRKNFVMIESSNGARASAMIYILVETAKANRLNIYQYFELLLTEIPKHMDDKNRDFLEELLPWSSIVQKNVQAAIRNLKFLRFKSISNSADTLQKCRVLL